MHETSKEREQTSRQSQADRFKEAARELGADDDEAAFNAKLRKLVKQKPEAKDDDKGK